MTKQGLRRWLAGSLTSFVVVLSLAACSGVPGQAPAKPPTPTATPAPAHSGQTADQLMAGLKAKGLPIGESVVFTAETDGNNLLGRPGQYIGKVAWHDTRVTDSTAHGTDLGVDDGGTIETFANGDDAVRRYTYVNGFAQSGGIFAEYDYLDGVALLRITRMLTPEQANAYRDAFSTLP